METSRDKVRRIFSNTCVQVLMRAMADSGICCARGAPLCQNCEAAIQNLKLGLMQIVDTFPDDAIERLAAAPEEEIANVIRDRIEPEFRKHAAKDFVS
jgi:hypothetical protein